MNKFTDSNGNLYPVIRNFLNIAFLIVGIFLGWFGNIVWNRQAESDQLVKDSKELRIIGKAADKKEVILNENIKNAKTIKQNNCNCGDATDIEFTKQLRKNREKGFRFDGKMPF